MRIRHTPKLIAATALLAIAPHALAGATQPEPDERTQRAIRAAEDISLAFSFAAEAVRPSVVGVTSVRRVEMRRGRPGPQLPGDPFFDRFFEDFFDRFQPPGQRDMPRGDRPGQPQPDTDRYFERRGGGSGFIVSEEGYILTNNHVIQDASEITVRLNDGTTRTATLVGADPQSDLAVIKIDTEGLSALTPARFADSDEIRIGQWVVAAGDPFGLTSTITAGVISATGRSRIGLIDYEDFIQTDAAINPGNSGGPLVNLRGEVVGVNTAIASRTGGFMGIGFAIPSNMAEMVMRELIDEGVVTRGWLGVALQDLTPELARTFGFEGEGVLVSDVPEGPAKNAGIQPGDIIVRFDGRDIGTFETLRMRVARTAPGTVVPVEVFREREALTISVEIGTRETEQVAAAPQRAPEPQIDRELGFSLRASQSGQGVTVTGVEPGSPAQRQGFAAGDTILRVGDTEVNSPAEFRRALREHRELGSARLLVSRGNMRSFRLLSFD